MVLVINLDFEEPSQFMTHLSAWVDGFSKKLANVSVPLEVQDALRKQLQTYVTNYREVELDENQNVIRYLPLYSLAMKSTPTCLSRRECWPPPSASPSLYP